MNRLITVILLFQVLTHIKAESVKRASVEDKGDHVLICSQEPIDFGIVFDSSSSIDTDDFIKAKEFLVQFLKQFDIGIERDDVRVSIITFGLGIYKQESFNLDTHHTKAGVLEAIGKINHKKGPYTDTGLAIKYMHDEQLSSSRVRPYAEKIGLVITDGNSQNWPETRNQARSARADNITMFALGVGSERQVGGKELERIAGDKSRVTRVDNFDSLQGVLEILAKKTCIRKEKPTTTTTTTTTTPVPKAQTCGELNPADIEFIFSPSDLGLDATAWVTNFISTTISSNDLDNEFRYGVRTGSCPDDEGFNLDIYDNVNDIKEHLSYYDTLKLPSLISTDLFDEKHGGRDNARDVAVLVVSGSKGMKGGELQAKIKELLDHGVEVYIANPAGYKIDIPGTTGLSGRSSRSQSVAFVNTLCPKLSGIRN